MKNGKMKTKKFNIKNAVVTISIAALVIAGVVSLIIIDAKSKGTNLEMALKEVEMPKAISIDTERTPDISKGTFHWEKSLEDGEDGNKIQVPVPTGYVGGCVADESYVNGVTTEGVREHSGGYVIYEKKAGESDAEARTAISNNLTTAQKERNQYVWVPISSSEVGNMYHTTSSGVLYGNYYAFTADGYSITKTATREPNVLSNRSYDRDNNYLKQYLEGISTSEFLQEMREEFHEMIQSVTTYGGFYIGRYETGNLSQNGVKIVKGQTGTKSTSNPSANNINYITWYKAYLKSRSLRGTNPVHTGLIWGIQWDETLKWLIDSGEKTYAEVGSDSTSWGNHSNATFSYTDVSGSPATKSGSKLIPTGSAEYTKANNIYDLAGNVYEWTMESGGSDYRCCRGGYYNAYGSNSPAQTRYSYNPNKSGNFIGCRSALYIS